MSKKSKSRSERTAFLAVDPGTKSTGIAVWDSPSTTTNFVPHFVDLLIASDRDNWFTRAHAMSLQFRTMLIGLRPRSVVIELPEYYGHDPATATQSIIKLTVLVGMMAALSYELDVPELQLIPVSQWKGQMSKGVVQRRIIKLLAPHDCSGYEDDIWDAVGLGLYHLGKEI